MGGAGLVGSHLCDRLLAEGHEVIAVDDLSSGSWANVKHLEREPRFVFEEHDVARPFRAEVDAVYHLALPSSRVRVEADPVRGTVTNVMGTLHALETASAHHAPVILATSIERFGEGLRCAESLVDAFRHVDVRSVRVAPTYGPRSAADDANIVVQLVLQSLRGEPLRPRMPLEHVVRLAYVDGVVDALLAAAMSSVVAPFVSARVADVVAAVADCGEGRALVASGVRPKSSATPSSDALREGVARTMVWFRDRMPKPATVRKSGTYPITLPTHAQSRRRAG